MPKPGDALRAQDEQLWAFLAEQHQDFQPEAWQRFDVVERIDLALYAAYLSMGDWFGHFEALHQVAEALAPGITDLETFTRRVEERRFDLTRNRYMLQSEIGLRYHGTPYWKPERLTNPLPSHDIEAILRETIAHLSRSIQRNDRHGWRERKELQEQFSRGYQGDPVRMYIVGDMAHWRRTGEGRPLLIDCWFSHRVLWAWDILWVNAGYNRNMDPLEYDEDQAWRWPEIEPAGSMVEAYTLMPIGKQRDVVARFS